MKRHIELLLLQIKMFVLLRYFLRLEKFLACYLSLDKAK